MDNIVPIINALSSLIIVLLIAYIVVFAWIDTVQRNKQMSMKRLAQKAHVEFMESFGYNPNTPITSQTALQIIQDLAGGHSPSMSYYSSIDKVFIQDKLNGRP